MCEISVICPVYNVKPYLKQCINSILLQSFKNFELLLIDDGSTDGSEIICNIFEKKDSRIRVIHQENQGVSGARNVGLDHAKGTYIAFIDSDDIVNSKYLEQLYNSLTNNNADISVCNYLHFASEDDIKNCDVNSDGIRIYSGREACKKMYISDNDALSMVTLWGKLIPNNMFDNIRFPIGKIHEDQFVIYKILYKCKKCIETKEKLYCYRYNPTGIINSTFSNSRYDDIIAMDQAIDFYKKKNDKELVHAASRLRESLIAKYSIMARKAKKYKNIPEPYKMSLQNAIKKIQEIHGIDYYEMFMYRYYPNIVKLQAYLRRLRKIIDKR